MESQDGQLSRKLEIIKRVTPVRLEEVKKAQDCQLAKIIKEIDREVSLISNELDYGLEKLALIARYFGWARRRLESARNEVLSFKNEAFSAKGNFFALGNLLGLIASQRYRQEEQINAIIRCRSRFVLAVNAIGKRATFDAGKSHQNAVESLNKTWARSQNELAAALKPLTDAFADAMSKHEQELRSAGRLA